MERNNAPYVGRYVAEQIKAIPVEAIRESHEEGYPTVLVIGPNPFLKRVYDVIKERFPQAQLKTSAQPVVEPLDGYRRLTADEDSQLAWRIIIHCDRFDEADEVLAEGDKLATAIPDEYRERHSEFPQVRFSLHGARRQALESPANEQKPGVTASMLAIVVS